MKPVQRTLAVLALSALFAPAAAHAHNGHHLPFNTPTTHQAQQPTLSVFGVFNYSTLGRNYTRRGPFYDLNQCMALGRQLATQNLTPVHVSCNNRNGQPIIPPLVIPAGQSRLPNYFK